MRLALGIVFWFCALLPARAEPVWFVSIANIAPGKQAQYDNFVSKVTPIWNENGMTVIARMKIIDGPPDLSFEPPHEIAVLKAETRKGFRKYISSPEYAAIKDMRLDAVGNFVVLEGKAVSTAGLKFINRNPAAVIILSPSSKKSADGINIAIALAGQVKGPVAKFLQTVQSVQVYPLAFEDNPEEYASDGDVMFIGERMN